MLKLNCGNRTCKAAIADQLLRNDHTCNFNSWESILQKTQTHLTIFIYTNVRHTNGSFLVMICCPLPSLPLGLIEKLSRVMVGCTVEEYIVCIINETTVTWLVVHLSLIAASQEFLFLIVFISMLKPLSRTPNLEELWLEQQVNFNAICDTQSLKLILHSTKRLANTAASLINFIEFLLRLKYICHLNSCTRGQ